MLLRLLVQSVESHVPISAIRAIRFDCIEKYEKNIFALKRCVGCVRRILSNVNRICDIRHT